MAAGLGFKTFTTGEVLTAGDVNGYLMQGVLVFASEAARNSAITSPQEGQFAYTKDTNSLWYYTGSAWAASGATGDIEGVTAGTGISGGGTSGTVTITNSMATAIDAKGDLVAGTGADAFSRLGVGANNTVLTADSAEATGLKWATPASGGGMTLISRQTISASSGFSFSSINQSYTDLKLRFTGLYAGDGSTRFVMRLNNDSGSNYLTSSGLIYTGAANAQTTTQTYVGEGGFYLVSYNSGATGNSVDQTNGDITFANYASTTLWKQYTGGWLYWNNATPQVFWSYMYGRYASTTAITSIDFVRFSGSSTINTGTNGYVELWGIK
jgi:hypothetical protein